jgi:hypothetical protein
MKRLALLLIVVVAALAVPAWADTPSQTMGSGFRSASGTTTTTNGQVVGSGH